MFLLDYEWVKIIEEISLVVKKKYNVLSYN